MQVTDAPRVRLTDAEWDRLEDVTGANSKSVAVHTALQAALALDNCEDVADYRTGGDEP